MRTHDPVPGIRTRDQGPGTLDPKLQDPQPRIKNLGPLDQIRLPNTYFDMLLRRENGSDKR